jgi:DNA repair protein RadA/Sms
VTPVEKAIFACQNCGATYPKWTGRCGQCGEWNSILEERVSPGNRGTAKGRPVQDVAMRLDGIDSEPTFRMPLMLSEFDRVIGGGLVTGSSVLIAGDPGIGKSTLLLQAAGNLAEQGHTVLYVTGEESPQQIRYRADRLRLSTGNVTVASTRELIEIKQVIDSGYFGFVIIDSIQTLRSQNFDSSPGTVTQIRECVSELQSICSVRRSVLLLIGHITKEGVIAGPKVLEHMVDVVLYFEGDRNHLYRVLRAQKNRFGPTAEIGIFAMSERGLSPVENPSELFLSERTIGISGQVIVCSLEGIRPILFELQALVTDATYSVPQRVSSGFDQKRLSLLLAILEKKEEFKLASRDVYLNLAGGLRIDEPAIDLGVVVAVVSSYEDTPVRDDTVIIGEVGLGGEVRSVSRIESRIAEAAALGFRRALIPARNAKSADNSDVIDIVPVSHISDSFSAAFK